jgi:hypothetical protein
MIEKLVLFLDEFLGAGGSIGFASPSKNLSFAYVINRIATDPSIIVDPRIKLLLDQIARKINH